MFIERRSFERLMAFRNSSKISFRLTIVEYISSIPSGGGGPRWKERTVLRSIPVRGATPSTTWLSRLNKPPCESWHIRTFVCRVLLRDCSHSREQKHHVSTTNNGDNLAPTFADTKICERKRYRKIFEWKQCYPTRYEYLRARCMVCMYMFSYTCVYTMLRQYISKRVSTSAINKTMVEGGIFRHEVLVFFIR